MFKLWCEWDFGQDYLIFATKKAAIKWFNENEDVIEAFDNDMKYEGEDCGEMTPYEFYEDQGLVGLEKVEVIS